MEAAARFLLIYNIKGSKVKKYFDNVILRFIGKFLNEIFG